MVAVSSSTTMVFTTRDAGPMILDQSFCCATRDAICFVLDPFLFRCPNALGSVPLAPTSRNPNASSVFPMVQTKIVDFFRIQRSSESIEKETRSNIRKRKRASDLAMSKKKGKLLAYSPTEDPQRRLEQVASLATALRASGTEYSNELTYWRDMALRSANGADHEKGGMQVLPKEDIEALNLCKRMMEKGECPLLWLLLILWKGSLYRLIDI